MSIHKNYAVVGVSLPRDNTFSGLKLDDELKKRDSDPWCGVLVVDLAKGDIKHWLRFDDVIRELFDVAVIPGVKCPMVVSNRSSEIDKLMTWDEKFN